MFYEGTFWQVSGSELKRYRVAATTLRYVRQNYQNTTKTMTKCNNYISRGIDIYHLLQLFRGFLDSLSVIAVYHKNEALWEDRQF